ncbi:MAG: malate dehydrogenase [Candidatus Bathyarchaeia archaeon]
MHIAQIGTGRVGRPTAYAIMCTELADTLTVCDTKPGLAAAFAEELRHVTASTGINVELVACQEDEHVSGADLIFISAGEPRAPGVKMSRRDLAVQNAKTVKYVSEATAHRNPGAKYVVITNPVDAMGMICKKFTRADFVISTGTNLESLRFRAKIAETLGVPVSKVEGWVGGEHGDAAVPLWSTVKIAGLTAADYAALKNRVFAQREVESYVKSVSKLIIDGIGGTEFGPAASFRDIARAIVKNTGEILSIAAPAKFAGVPEPTFIGVPTHLGQSVGSSLFGGLTEREKKGLADAAAAIYQTYAAAVGALE